MTGRNDVGPNWKTTLGGAIFVLGTTLFGAPVALTFTSVEIPQNWVQACVFVGFILQAVGGFITAVFARDRKVSDEQAGAGNKPPMPVTVIPPLTPPADGTTKQP